MNRLRVLVVRGGRRPAGLERTATIGRGDADDAGGDGHEIDDSPELLLVIDGLAALDGWDGRGLAPDDLLNPDLPLIPPAGGSAVRRVVQRCLCGEIGCGSLTVRIRRSDDVISWSEARDPRRVRGIGPFTFAASEYEAEVRRAHRDRPWESRDERIARLVSDAFRALRDARPRSFDWSSVWGDGRVVVSFTDRRADQRGGEPIGPWQTIGRDSGQSIEPDELFDQHLGSFEIPQGVDDGEAVAAIVRRIRETDPYAWPRPDL